MKNTEGAAMPRLEFLLAGLLRYGTWLASAVTAAGLALATHSAGMRIVTAGIALFILLPVLRVLLMLFVFIAQRDYKFVAITAIVLTVIVAGCILGLHMAGGRTPAPKKQSQNQKA